ncbi:alpha/beta hydrolase family protein [Mumia flava]|uniref:Alpha/beta hydrolase family protein n=1 Tax=Mumia flava TaxID=1348852 RepID=A0A0B2BLL6_9ACTN|nr:alpha/beta fold hydrolase [Mumia flava]PJJ56347.1 alpha/beta hydrolase family protein [Mumia flava]
MTTFLLVHGAFRGGWAWRRVRPHLVAAGHDVYAPSLVGAGERVGEPVAGLATWVDQLAGLLDTEDLTEVVAVAHSQGGVVVRALVAAAPERIAQVVYLDAAVPDPGERAIDLTPPPPGFALPGRDALVPARPPEPGGDVDDELAAWMAGRLTPTPFAPSLDRVVVTAERAVPASYVFCADTPAGYPSEVTRTRLDERGIGYRTLDAGHDAPLTAPRLVADVLLTAVERPA